MRTVIASFAWALMAATAGQAPNSLGDDPWKFDQLLDTAFVRRDIRFLENVVTDDLRFIDDVRAGAPVLGKQDFLKAVRFSEALERTVDSVLVEFHDETVKTRGHIQVKTLRSVAPAYQIYYVRDPDPIRWTG